jgi:ribosomal protein L7/L12
MRNTMGGEESCPPHPCAKSPDCEYPETCGLKNGWQCECWIRYGEGCEAWARKRRAMMTIFMTSKVDQLNQLHRELTAYRAQFPNTRVPHMQSYEGILNAYREGDLTFAEAVKEIDELKPKVLESAKVPGSMNPDGSMNFAFSREQVEAAVKKSVIFNPKYRYIDTIKSIRDISDLSLFEAKVLIDVAREIVRCRAVGKTVTGGSVEIVEQGPNSSLRLAVEVFKTVANPSK